MNILHVNMSLDPVTGGGTVERVRQLHAGLKKMAGVQSRLLSIASPNASATDESGDVVLLPCWNRRWFLFAPKLPTIFRMVRRADIIHLINHWTLINALVFLLARLAGKPYVICPAGALSLFGRSKGFKRLYKKLIGNALVRNAAGAIAITEDEVATLMGYRVPAARIEHIPNGVRFEDYRYADGDMFRKHVDLGQSEYLLFMGRLNEIKGPDLLLEAFVGLSPAHPDLHLVFAGPAGGMAETLGERAYEAGVADRVHFAGYVGGDLKSSAYHGTAMLIVPSRQEAMSIVALEGAVCGIPVVMTDRCGFDALAEAGAARLCRAESRAIAGTVAELMADPELRLEMGEKGRRLAISNYTWDIAAERHLKLFNRSVYGIES